MDLNKLFTEHFPEMYGVNKPKKKRQLIHLDNVEAVIGDAIKRMEELEQKYRGEDGSHDIAHGIMLARTELFFYASSILERELNETIEVCNKLKGGNDDK